MAATRSAIESNTRLLLCAVRLYKALGGGWESFEPTESDAHPSDPRSVASTAKERT
jgi:outer membrane protein TolC